MNGQLAGRGGRCGCSLGFGGNNLPAVALIGPNVAVTVDDVFEGPEPIVELWNVAGGAAAKLSKQDEQELLGNLCVGESGEEERVAKVMRAAHLFFRPPPDSTRPQGGD